MTTPTDQRISEAAIRLFVEKGTTQLTVSELAQAANVARGTLYRNIGSLADLFDRVVGEFSADLHQRVSASFDGIDDPAARLATGLRLWIRHAYENPAIGRFAVRFGLSEESLRAVMSGPPMRDINAGVAAGRYDLGSLSVDSIASMVLGATVSAMWMVLEGHQTWREAGSATAELVLRAMGIQAAEAREIAMAELPRLAT
ncbi:MAG TPA: TetR/AcrR family transcriptional regulator [Mycobacterium sp.]|nr:TetR/AcrR family transcriptional regulator [Mycobacterium sp.]